MAWLLNLITGNLLEVLTALVAPILAALFMRERGKRKKAEQTTDALKKRAEIKDEVRNESDDALIDRLSK